jgi:LacI family transcriptional regulator
VRVRQGGGISRFGIFDYTDPDIVPIPEREMENQPKPRPADAFRWRRLPWLSTVGKDAMGCMKARRMEKDERKRTVALIMPPVPSYSRALMQGVIEQHSASRPWHLIDLPHLKVGRSPLPFNHDRLDGAIVWADRRDLWIERLAAEGVKVVNCGSAWLGVPGVASVHVDRKRVSETLAGHIRELGLRQLVIVGHLINRRPDMHRFLDGIATHVRSCGMEVVLWELEGRNNPEDAPRRVLEADREHKLRALLQKIPKPAAIFCENDHIGVLICRVARDCGIRIPEDLAVVGYGENLVAQYCDPPLTSMSPPGTKVGAAAAKMLAKWIESGQPPRADVMIPEAEIEVRESTLGRSGSAELERVRRFIQRNEDQSLSLASLAEVAGVSTRTLIRKYTAAFGIDPLEDWRQRRLEKAKGLLEDPDVPVGEVAVRCGFASQANFYNYFQRHTGMSPTVYRGRRR